MGPFCTPISSCGRNAAATEIYLRFSRRLIGLVKRRLSSIDKRKIDASDIVQSVYRSFFRRQADDEFELSDWDSLWSLLASITVRKCLRKRRDLRRALRDVRRESPLPERADGSAGNWEPHDLKPSPEDAAILVETVNDLLSGLDDRDQEIVSMRLQGYEELEIGEKVECSERTVHRVLHRIRQRLLKRQESDDGVR